MTTYLIFDTSSLLRGLRIENFIRKIADEINDSVQIVIPTGVYRELKDKETKFLLETYRHILEIIDPPARYINEVKNIANKYGGSLILSEPDISVLALAVFLLEKYKGSRVIVFTEDFDIQNLAKELDLPYKSIQGRRIKKVLIYLKKCVVCGTLYNATLEDCPSCGSKEFKIVTKKLS